METYTPKTIRLLWLFCGIAVLVPCAFFAYYSIRLLYVNLTMSAEDAATHRTGGMLIGAIAFPLATVVIGLVAAFCFKTAFKTPKLK
jgi:amino acid permease